MSFTTYIGHAVDGGESDSSAAVLLEGQEDLPAPLTIHLISSKRVQMVDGLQRLCKDEKTISNSTSLEIWN